MAAVDRCLEKGPSVMSRAELSGLARDSQSLADLHKGAWRAPEWGYWGQCITRRSHEQVSGQDPVSG